MTGDPDAFAHHLGRLDSPHLDAFVADLWSARGYETVRRDGLVVASRGSRTVVLEPVARNRFDGGALGETLGRVRGGGLASAADRHVDVVVAPRGGSRAERLATDRGARVLVADDLREMLDHAVAPADAARLCAEHLGAPPSALARPLSHRLRDRLAGVESPVSGSTVLLALLAVTLVVGAGAAQPFFESPGPSPAADAGAGASAGGTDSVADAGGAVGPVDVAATDSDSTSGGIGDDATSFPTRREGGPTVLGAPNESSVAAVPGLGVDGVTNVTALADAQVAALDADSFTLWLDRYEPRDGVTDPTVVQRDVDVAVEGDRYLVETELETNGSRERVSAVYYDGTGWVAAEYENGTPVAERVDADSPASPFFRDPRQLGRSLVLQYLDTPESNVTAVVERDGRRLLRLQGSSLPPGRGLERIQNYEVVAYVGTDGLVYEATATFGVVTDEGTYRVRFEWTYGQFDATRVSAPAWATANPDRADG